MGRFVISVVKPKSGKHEQLRSLLANHWRMLSELGLVTDTPRSLMQSSDGTILDVFEWRSVEAIEAAHHNPDIQALWGEFEAVCDYIPLSALPESQVLFAEFEAITA